VTETNIVALLGRATQQTGAIIDGVKDDQWNAPTPCTEWDVRTIVAHLVRGNENTAAIAAGNPRNPNPIAELGDDPKARYRDTAAAMVAALSDPDLLGKTLPSPFGELPAPAVLSIRMADTVTHGWDIARATGQPAAYDDDIVQTVLQFTQRGLANRPPSGPFAPPVSIPEDAPAIDRLAAFLGRTP